MGIFNFIMNMKKCKQCLEHFSIDCFKKCKSGRDGYRATCNSCISKNLKSKRVLKKYSIDYIDKETWVDIKGYEGHYMISDFGRVMALEREVNGYYLGTKKTILKPQRILKKVLGGGKYYTVTLGLNSNKNICSIHRLVAENFIDNPLNKLEVNHIDGNKLNNNLVNLEWCSRKENVQHAFRIGLMKGYNGEENFNVKISEMDVVFIRQSTEKNIELAKKFGVTASNIGKIKLRKTWKNI